MLELMSLINICRIIVKYILKNCFDFPSKLQKGDEFVVDQIGIPYHNDIREGLFLI